MSDNEADDLTQCLGQVADGSVRVGLYGAASQSSLILDPVTGTELSRRIGPGADAGVINPRLDAVRASAVSSTP